MQPDPAFVRKLKEFDSDLYPVWNNVWRAYRRKDTGELVKLGRWQIKRKRYVGAVRHDAHERTILDADGGYRPLDNRVIEELRLADWRRTLGRKGGERDPALISAILEERKKRDVNFERSRELKELNAEQDNEDYTRKNVDKFFRKPHSVS